MAALVGVLITACSAAEPAVVEVFSEEYAFETTETVPAGLVRMQLTNRGSKAHAAQIYRLDDGATLDQFMAAMQTGIAAERAIASALGGPANIDGGETGPIVEMVLEPGNYVVVCWLLDSEGTPHAFSGMVDTFEVVGDAGDAALPSPEATFELTEYEIQVPDGFDGSGTFGVVNRGGEWHELIVLEIDEEQETEVALAHLTGGTQVFPTPYTSRGGVGGLEVDGGEGRVDLDLAPGRYLVVCAVPTNSQVYHATLGMWTEVTVEG